MSSLTPWRRCWSLRRARQDSNRISEPATENTKVSATKFAPASIALASFKGLVTASFSFSNLKRRFASLRCINWATVIHCRLNLG
ncbi:hypothetical protein DASB73_025320 [Starmerella bacillaris]|uniref:Uncharacterized protein n=1 Tax=Starmerella bacillaris TaxID=1247836 RepID=A0AAV5RJ43_STABA|nr:hypothetical protein DASB73_025320 [Starmerella bacillaris]